MKVSQTTTSACPEEAVTGTTRRVKTSEGYLENRSRSVLLEYCQGHTEILHRGRRRISSISSAIKLSVSRFQQNCQSDRDPRSARKLFQVDSDSGARVHRGHKSTLSFDAGDKLRRTRISEREESLFDFDTMSSYPIRAQGPPAKTPNISSRLQPADYVGLQQPLSSRWSSDDEPLHDRQSHRLRGPSTHTGSTKTSSTKPRWLSSVKDWLSVSEPSAQAMKEQKQQAHRRFPVNPRDPKASSTMHLSTSKIPQGAVKSTSGPSPEQALRAQGKPKQQRYSQTSTIPTSASISSRGSRSTSTQDLNQVTPWE